MWYKVYDTIKKKFIANNSDIILKPNGRLASNDYGDEIGVSHCIALFFPTDSDNYYIDELGGIHDSGCGWAPDGTNCGECSNISCKICSVWREKKSHYGNGGEKYV